jgi:amidase
MTAIHDLSALEQAATIAGGGLTAREVAEHYLARTEQHGAEVGAFITLTADLALAQADAADARVRSRRTDLPPLLGAVVPVKDLEAMAGVRMTGGSAVFDLVPDRDDHAVARMRRAGLVCTGKTNTPEFGLPAYTEGPIAPPARTPWDLRRGAGGSSGGAAAAVATGLASAAQGSDGGGSIRIPASCCGLVGLKPSRGRVSTGPLPEQAGELAVVGPLARTVADAAALLDVLAGPEPDDLRPAPPLPVGETFLAAAGRPPGRLRIGRYRDPVIAATDLDPEVVGAYEAASALLQDLGHEVVELARPFPPDVVPQFEALWSVGALSVPVPPADEGRLMPLTRWLRERGRRTTGLQVAGALSRMRELAGRALRSAAEVDVVLTPTLAKLPAPVAGLRNDADPAADFEAQKEFTPFTSPYNMTGQPAITVPIHWTGAGLPVGVQLVGGLYAEATIIALAAQLEQARPWRMRRHDRW